MATLIGASGNTRKTIGYCWPWTVRPRERVDFMVSSEEKGSYQASLVRIICGDALSRPDMFKEEELQSTFNGRYQCRLQSTETGSYVEIPSSAALGQLTSFTVQAMVFPTMLPNGTRLRGGGGANSWEDPPLFRDQHLISRWNDREQRGWALLINAEGKPVLMVGDGHRTRRATLGRALVQDKWFLVVGSLDPNSKTLRIAAKAVGTAPGDLAAWEERWHEERCPSIEDTPQIGPLRFGACAEELDGQARPKPAYCFNGRLDRVRLADGMLSSEESLLLSRTALPQELSLRIIGFWDFSIGVDRTEITDLSPNSLHGVAINLPTRAVRGVDWDGSANNWKERPEQYSAIHFHEDDLYDAGWEVDFSYTVPDDLPSGIYAARLRGSESEDYIPFFVAPPRQRPRARVALLLPTMTYTAYTNITGLTTLKRKRQVEAQAGVTTIVEEDLHPCLLQSATDAEFLLKNLRFLGKGVYSNHADGTLKCHASQRHPNVTLKPKSINWTLTADTYITDWLEQKQIAYDVLTDDLLHEEGIGLLARYTVVLTGNHPEYYTRRMLDAVDQYQRQGGRLMYLGGNGFYWVTSLHAQLPGVIEVRKDTYAGHLPQCERQHAFDGESGGRWANSGRSPALLVGLTYDFAEGYAMEGGAPYLRLPDSQSPRAAFIFDGIEGQIFGEYGIFGGGVAGQEVDTIDRESGTPAHALHLARAQAFPQYGSLVSPEYKVNTRGPIADLIFFETPNSGAVFSVGSMSWVGALSHNGYNNDVSRMTENVLRRFMDRTPFMRS